MKRATLEIKSLKRKPLKRNLKKDRSEKEIRKLTSLTRRNRKNDNSKKKETLELILLKWKNENKDSSETRTSKH